MYAKHCFSAFACALALGVATGGYAQSLDALAPVSAPVNARSQARFYNPKLVRPALLTPSQAFHTVMPVPVKSVTRVGQNAPKPFVGTTTLYQNIPTIIDPHDVAGLYFRLSPPALPQTCSALMDDFILPAGMAGTTGATVSDVSLMVRNFGTAAQDVYGEITFYDDVVYTLTTDPSDHVVNQNPLGTFTFKIPALGAGIRDYYNLVLPTTGTPVTLTRDLSSTVDTNQNGFEVRFYDDAARTVPSPFITAQFPLNTADNPGVQVGESNDSFWFDLDNIGAFEGPYEYFGGSPHLGNLILQINGTAPNPATYSMVGTVTFPTLTTAGPINLIWQIHPHSAGASFASDILITGSLDLTDAVDPVTGATVGEEGTYELIGFPADTYDVDIIPDGFADVNDPNIVLTQNAYGVDATFDTVGSPVTGNIALEGVADLSTVSDNAPLGLYRASFRAPGMTTELYGRDVTLTTSAGSPSGAFSATGIPDGTYDVLIKGSKNLAVLVAGVVVSGGGTTTDVTLPAGDANNDNSVDTTDFGLLVGSYGSDSAVAGGGYDPAEDFNFDGVVDTSDFGLLVGEYGNIGAM